MAKGAEEKSRGLKFAEQQLLRHGWERGKGLGRGENGITEALKVNMKCDKGGMGHNEGEQFTFHWWDHVFNKASTSLAVESREDGVMLKKVKGKDQGQVLISNKKPRKAELAKAKLYGRFVKSATLVSGLEQPAKAVSSSGDSSSSEDEDLRLDLSTATKLSDEDLVKACGGRTAHKGARHGLTMSAKLARLQQQEQQFLEKYGKKIQAEKCCSENTVSGSTSMSSKEGEDRERKRAKKRKTVSQEEQQEAETSVPQKKKRSKDKCDARHANTGVKGECGQRRGKGQHQRHTFTEALGNGDAVSGPTNEDVILRRETRSGHNEGVVDGVNEHDGEREVSGETAACQTKRRRKSKKKKKEEYGEEEEQRGRGNPQGCR